MDRVWIFDIGSIPFLCQRTLFDCGLPPCDHFAPLLFSGNIPAPTRKPSEDNSIAFGKSTSQRICPEQ